MLSRRALLAAAALGPAGCAVPVTHAPDTDFVRVRNGRFEQAGRAYRFVGANLWYGAYIGAESDTGNRERLGRELDRLKALGITNLRVLGSSELSPLKNSLTPAFRDRAPPYNEALLAGLDTLLAEMAKRDMRA